MPASRPRVLAFLMRFGIQCSRARATQDPSFCRMNLYARLDQATVIESPFPHLVLDDALDPAFADALLAEMPAMEVLTQGAPPGSNQRFSLSAALSLKDDRVSAKWRELVEESLSQPFLDRLLTLFKPHIVRELPEFVQRMGDLNQLRAVLRYTPEHVPGTVGLDAQICINTPALEAGTTVKGPHLDITDKLFIGLLYFRHAGDESQGANLEFYDIAEQDPLFDCNRCLARERVTLLRTMPYRHNRLVLMLNTPRALHGVSPRAATPHARYFLNLVAVMNDPVFTVRCEPPPPPPEPAPATLPPKPKKAPKPPKPPKAVKPAKPRHWLKRWWRKVRGKPV
ncbi:hypothetical protein AYO49_02845 [Verrucomicrobiaceae bacterium SCGC AG-212-N21]|nr:hypothetical protein AYO49_02845 [Verrucomicrobiaceae bacterium SCGC AG-212-N21]